MLRNALATTRGRLLFALAFVFVLEVYAIAGFSLRRHGESAPLPSPTASSNPYPSPSPSPTAASSPSPTPNPYLVPETRYQSGAGLRFADRDAFAAKLAAAKTFDEARNTLEDFFAEYDMAAHIGSDPTDPPVKIFKAWDDATSDNLSDLKSYGNLLIEEWSKYPKSWVKLTKIKGIVLARGVPGSANADDSYLILRIGVVSSPVVEDFMRGSIHHEFTHVAESGIAIEGSSASILNPENWQSLNPLGFAYSRDNMSLNPSIHPPGGFVTSYAQVSYWEDRAELNSYLMTAARYRQMNAWIATDELLQRKTAAFKDFVKGKVPFMDDAYYDAINPYPSSAVTPI